MKKSDTSNEYLKHKDQSGNITLVQKQTYIGNITKNYKNATKRDKLTPEIIGLDTYIRNIVDWQYENILEIKNVSWKRSLSIGD